MPVGDTNSNVTGFLSETCGDEKEVAHFSRDEERKELSTEKVYPAKLFFRNKGEITFLEKEKRKELLQTYP